MANFSTKIKKKLKWYKSQIKSSLAESYYVYCRNKLNINNNQVLFQSRWGNDLGGNIFYLLKETVSNYPQLKIYLAYKDEKKAYYEQLLHHYDIKNVEMIKLHGRKYWKILATSKYLLNDDTFHTSFIKRKGQIYLNTWHGTPLKTMGLDEAGKGYLFGNMQRNFLAADYLLYPNRFMTDVMVKAYSLNKLFMGKIVNEGYPRNAIFFDKSRAEDIRKELGLINKQVIVYMPTWRGQKDNIKDDDYIDQVKTYFDQIDNKLNENQIFYVKLHPLVNAKIKLDGYKHVKSFPTGYETYDFLNTADCLISDYSSIMFDFACSNKNIILFIYDEEEYLRDRGMYVSINELPFNKARTVDELIDKINNTNGWQTNAFSDNITEFDNVNAVKNICALVFEDKKCGKIYNLDFNNKPNVVVMVDNLLRNGITTAAFNLARTVDLNKRNFFYVFKQSGIRNTQDRIAEIPEGIGKMSVGALERTFSELVANFFYYKFNVNSSYVNYLVERCYKRNFEKYYGNIPEATFIHFTGYGREGLHLFKHAKRKFIFVHNDMYKEVYVKKIQHKNTLVGCYQEYDKVACVSEASLPIASNLAENKGAYQVVHNCFDYESVLEKAKKDIQFNKDTECLTMNTYGIEGILNSGGRKFITIGRFSPEKEHIRLIDAFHLYWNEHPDAKLIIIGGYGGSYKRTVDYARKQQCWGNICIIKSIDNPMAILNKCDLFVLSSSNEGLPVVFYEADCLHKPILSTDIDGPHEFLQQYQGGLLVEQSAEALYEGMKAFDRGEIKLLNIDFKQYNQQCIAEFEELFN